MARGRTYYYPADLNTRIAQLERDAGRGAASFADLAELARLVDRRDIRRCQRLAR